MRRYHRLLASVATLTLLAACSSSEGGSDNPAESGGGSGGAPAGGASGKAGTGGGSSGGGGIVVGQGGTSGEAGAGSGGFGSECAGESYEPEQAPALVQLVVDTSLSMDSDAPGSNRSKWEVTRDAITAAIDSLSPSLALGVMFYPNRSSGGSSNQPRDLSACVNVDGMVPIAPLGASGSAHRELIAEAFADAGPNGSTPTHDAYKYALDNSMKTTTLPGQRYMLLITDGVPTYSLNCVGSGRPNNPRPTQPIVDEIAAAAAENINTFIIGSPGSEDDGHGGDARGWMSLGAMVGGTGPEGCSETGPNFCHFDMTQEADFAAALAEALGAIAGHVVSCSYDVPTRGSDGQLIDRNKVNVTYTTTGGVEESIYFTEDTACSDGWRFDGDQLVLCENTCQRVQADPQAALRLVYGCQRRDQPPE